MSDLRDTLINIARVPSRARAKFLPSDTRPRATPTQWDLVRDRPECFGKDYDYDVTTRDDETIFWPISEAAIAWAYSKFPDIGRITREVDSKHQHGFILDTREAAWPLHCAGKDGLMSENDWREAQEEFHRSQWGD